MPGQIPVGWWPIKSRHRSKAIMKQWANREEKIKRVMGTMVGMFGDQEGIAGKSLQEIEGLGLLALSHQGDMNAN